MNKAMANIDTQAVVGGFTQSELDTLKATIARGTSNEQFALFVQTCARSGLNPFLNQIYCIVYNGKDGPVMSIQIAVEGIVSLAKRHSQYKGFIASEVKENDEFEIDVVSGEPKHRITTMQRGKTVGAYCVAYREGAPNIAVIVTADQVDHLIKGRNGQMWKDYFDDMIVKHTMKRAFKRQFGIEVAEDEHVQGGASIEPYERKVINSEETSTAAQLPQYNEPRSQPSEESEADMIKKARIEAKRKLTQLGLVDKMDEFIREHVNPKGAKLTLQEAIALNKVLDLKLAEQAQLPNDDELPL